MKPGFTAVAGLSLAALAVAASIQGSLLRELRSAGRPEFSVSRQPASPLSDFTALAIGGFRGLLADVLWVQAARLQDSGNYFELVQIASWITRLDPRSTATWSFMAWNMAYNISAMMPSDEDRWRWVQNGIRLLRDEALALAPPTPRLYFDLGWLYGHKIGAPFDRSHLYYKIRFATEVSRTVPDGRMTRLPQGAAASVRAALGIIPGRAQALERTWGPLDWRLPETHALYWATEGAHLPGQPPSLLCDRMVWQCLCGLTLAGTLDFDIPAQRYQRSPNPALLPVTIAAARALMRRYPDAGIGESFDDFLLVADKVFTEAGHAPAAAEVRREIERRNQDRI